MTGSVAFETVKVGSLEVSDAFEVPLPPLINYVFPQVPHQELGIVNKAAWVGDGINSGLLGLAEPTLTSVFNGTDPDLDVGGKYDPYNPFFYTAVADKKVKNPCEHQAPDIDLRLYELTFTLDGKTFPLL